MKNNKRLIASIVWIVIGFILSICNWFDIVDSYWTGMGTALLVVGSINLFRQIRYNKDAAYREDVETKVQDERNRFIATKAWSWSGYIFVIIASIASIALRALGFRELSMFASACACLIILSYWISYMILQKKY
jgi:uncharacterized membrane protein